MSKDSLSRGQLEPVQKVIDAHYDSLRTRLGSHHFNKRLELEGRLKFRKPSFLKKIGHQASHYTAFFLIRSYLKMVGLYDQAVANCWNTQLIQNTIHTNSSKLKSSIRILHLSDLHLDTNFDQTKRWIELISGLEYDLAVITGDFYNAFRLPGVEGQVSLQSVVKNIQSPVYGILGNHDSIFTTPFIEKMGVRMLLNETDVITVNDQQIQITGLDDPHRYRTHDLNQAVENHDVDLSVSDLKLLLLHAPKVFPGISAHEFDVCLCGHTHGGQMRTLSGKPLLKSGSYPRDMMFGNWQYHEVKGYTSQGTGTGKLTFRLNCHPEITLHEIRST